MTRFLLGGCTLARLLFIPLVSVACAGESEDLDTGRAGIINGTPPSSAGALVNYGVVNFGCSGTMLTNQHVLTAHHCTGRYTPGGWTGTLTAPGTATVTLETPAGNVTAHNASFIEPPGNASTWTLDAGDYAIMVLDQPLSPGGVSDAFYNKVYSASDASLVNQTVLCIGYGATFEATPVAPAGGYMLTSANMKVSSASAGAYVRNRSAANVVGFVGDSGSTCFFNGLITGVQSTCNNGSYYDLNGNGQDDAWGENYNVPFCTSSAASSFRTFVSNNILSSVTVQYDAIPALPAGAPTAGTVSTPAGVANVNLFASATVSAPRSGYVTAQVTVEPDWTMCPTITQHAPMSGSPTFAGRCIGDGLLSVLIN